MVETPLLGAFQYVDEIEAADSLERGELVGTVLGGSSHRQMHEQSRLPHSLARLLRGEALEGERSS